MRKPQSDILDFPKTIRIRRPRSNIVEYAVTSHDPLSGDDTQTWHANGYATFHGPWTGSGNSLQMHGGAHTLWREDDNDMLMAFRRYYKNIAEVTLD